QALPVARPPGPGNGPGPYRTCQVAAGVAAHGSMTSLAPLATTGAVTHNPDSALASSTAMGPAPVSFHLVAAAPVHDPITSPAPALTPVSVSPFVPTLTVPSAD